MAITRKKACFGGLVSVLVICGVVVAFVLAAQLPEPTGKSEVVALDSQEGATATDGERMLVHTIQPRRDPSFLISDREPAKVKAYFQDDLLARVAGPVKFVGKDIGDPVTQGEVLVEIDVPDLIQEVAQYEAAILKAEKEEVLAQKKVEIAQAAVEVAATDIDLKKALVDAAQANKDLRWLRWNRFKEAAARETVDPGVLDEEARDYGRAKAEWDAAGVAVKKADANLKEAKANLDAASADVNLKQALIEVARKDRDRAQAKADYAKIRAPFDGTIINRNVAPGSFVQNATTGHTEPVLTVARTDIVTVFVRVPDNFAPLVTKNTDVIIDLDALPGALIKGKVTRFAPSVEGKDLRMLVEVDLYNGSAQEYRKFVAKGLATVLAPIGVPRATETTALAVATRLAWQQHKKSMGAFPLLPEISGENVPSQGPHLFPGMTGYMRLNLPSDNSYLVPCRAVCSHGGKTYIVQVIEGTAHPVDVEVQAEDGKVAKVVKIIRQLNPKTGIRERVKKALNGSEEIVAGGQGEIADGQAVKATPVDWQRD